MATQTRLRQLVANVPDPATQQALAAIVVALEGTAGVPVQLAPNTVPTATEAPNTVPTATEAPNTVPTATEAPVEKAAKTKA